MFFTDYNFFKITFTDPASPLMYGIIELHDHIFFFLNMILFLVLFLLLTTLNFFSYKKNSILNRYLLSETTKNRYDWLRLSHGTTIEIIWTIVPSLVLILIAIPSFALLYATDEIIDPAVTVQVIGHQWYWSYEYNDLALTHEPLTHEPQKSPVDEFHFLDRNYLLGRTDPVRQFYDFVIDIKHQNLSTALKSFSKSSIYEISSNLKFFKVYLPNDFVVVFPNISYIPNHMLVDLLNGFPKVDFSSENYFNQFLVSAFDFSNENTTKGVELISGSIDFDSYMRQESDLLPGEKRLYETDFPLVLPKNTHIRFMITADDVIHSWAVPALGIKVDAVPGRINQAHTFIKRSGTFYGQCSELCGVNHAFMPIQILVFEPSMYYDYLRLMLLNK